MPELNGNGNGAVTNGANGSAALVETWSWPVAPVNLPSGSLVADSTAYAPRLGKSTCAA